MRSADTVEPQPRTPQVWADDDTWNQLAGHLVRRGICEPIEYEDISSVNGCKLLGGLMGVSKASHEKGSGPQRLIMNVIPSNHVQH
eukprot:90691-Karenia_brevis.AAC.1